MTNRSLIISIILIYSASMATAQSGGTFEIKRSTIDNGGGQSTGGSFELTGTIGQADASQAMTGGAFSLSGGFWSPSDSQPQADPIFSDGFES